MRQLINSVSLVISPSPLAGEGRERGRTSQLDPSDKAIGRAQPPFTPILSRGRVPGRGGPRGLLPWGSGKEVTSPPSPPGSRGALLLPSPLRTTRKPFGLCRSSLSQGPSRNPVGRRRTTCTILVWS